MARETRIHDETTVDDDAVEVPRIRRYAISSSGADYPLDALHSRLTEDDTARESEIYVPDFQRGYVWTKPQADRFIESLLLGLPVPGIFLSRDEKTGRLLVIDGSQRLRTIKFFIDGLFEGKEFVLGDKVHRDFRGKAFKDLGTVDRRDFLNSVIHATIVKQERPENDHTSIYYLFERINTGGTPAQPQEVRRAIYEGPLNRLLRELDNHASWRAIYGAPSKRLKDQELILRFLALKYGLPRYGKNDVVTMKEFLTDFMARNRNLGASQQKKFRKAFEETTDLVKTAVGARAFRTTGALNAAIFDAVMVGLSERLDRGPIATNQSVKRAYDRLLKSAAFAGATRTGTSQEANVRSRLVTAIKAFSNLE